MKLPQVQFSLRSLLLLPLVLAVAWLLMDGVPRFTAHRLLAALREGRVRDANALLSDCVVSVDPESGCTTLIGSQDGSTAFAFTLGGDMVQNKAASCVVDRSGVFWITGIRFQAGFGRVSAEFKPDSMPTGRPPR